MWRCIRSDAGAAKLRIESVAHPNDHFSFSGQWQDFGMQDFCASSGKSMSFVVGKFMEQFGFRRFAGIGGEDAVHIGPDDELVSVNDVSDQRAGEVRTVAAEGGDAAVASGTDKAGDHRDQAVLEKRKQYFAAAPPCFVNLGASIAESFASQHKFGRADRNRGYTGFFESGGEEARAEPLTIRGQTIL